MAASTARRQLKKDSGRRGSFLLPAVCLALIMSSFFICLSYISTSLYITDSDPPHLQIRSQNIINNHSLIFHQEPVSRSPHEKITVSTTLFESRLTAAAGNVKVDSPADENICSLLPEEANNKRKDDVFHDRRLFMENYKEMNKSLKIYTYPHKRTDPFANVFLPVEAPPTGNYASESYFKKALFESHLLTDDPSAADLFYLPFSIASLRHDKRVGVAGIQDFVRDYISNISRDYPFWNRTGGADHFYVACHSVGRSAMEKAVQVKLNAIQVVCSSSYFLPGYVSHKDASIPQIWPREGPSPIRSPSRRKKLAFYAGAMNSRVREFLVKTWENDSDISVHQSRLQTPYSEALLGSKFCIHVKGFEVNTARIGDSLYYGCVPVILSDHYDLPYADIINWNSFSVVLSTMDIPMMKKILQEIGPSEYLRLQRNVMRVQKHFQWHNVPVDYDAFYMVMYELWLRRSHVRIFSFDSFSLSG
ncbi:hypothetical protein OROHE_006466 [Orobanche hederae]